MELKKVIFIVFIIWVTGVHGANIIGYFTNWGIYGDQPYTASDVPYQKLTHIQYAFFKPEANGEISSFDDYADEQILLGEMIWSPTQHRDSTTSLIYLAHKNKVKVLASVGGWTGSSNFPSLAGSAISRSNFCSKARALIERYSFDGIDIDWEYPCYTEHNGTADDARNFVLLLAELRDTLDAMDGDKKLITLAIAGGSFHGKDFLVEQFHPDVDFISVMTYDYTGEWGSYAWHNSPLYDYGLNDNWSLSRAMDYYLQRGVPSSKLNIGLAFYGKSFAGCEGPNQPFTGPGEISGSIDYSTIDRKIQSGEYVRYWDDKAKVPYCLSSENEYCSFDDTVSIGLKSQYCLDKGFGGVIIWELKAGRLADGSQPLLNTVAEKLLSKVAVRKIEYTKSGRLEKLQVVNSRTGHLKVRFNGGYRADEISFKIYTLSGGFVFGTKGRCGGGCTEFQLPDVRLFLSGKYLLRINDGEEKYQTMFTIIK